MITFFVKCAFVGNVNEYEIMSVYFEVRTVSFKSAYQGFRAPKSNTAYSNS